MNFSEFNPFSYLARGFSASMAYFKGKLFAFFFSWHMIAIYAIFFYFFRHSKFARFFLCASFLTWGIPFCKVKIEEYYKPAKEQINLVGNAVQEKANAGLEKAKEVTTQAKDVLKPLAAKVADSLTKAEERIREAFRHKKKLTGLQKFWIEWKIGAKTIVKAPFRFLVWCWKHHVFLYAAIIFVVWLLWKLMTGNWRKKEVIKPTGGVGKDFEQIEVPQQQNVYAVPVQQLRNILYYEDCASSNPRSYDLPSEVKITRNGQISKAEDITLLASVMGVKRHLVPRYVRLYQIIEILIIEKFLVPAVLKAFVQTRGEVLFPHESGQNNPELDAPAEEEVNPRAQRIAQRQQQRIEARRANLEQRMANRDNRFRQFVNDREMQREARRAENQDRHDRARINREEQHREQEERQRIREQRRELAQANRRRFEERRRREREMEIEARRLESLEREIAEQELNQNEPFQQEPRERENAGQGNDIVRVLVEAPRDLNDIASDGLGQEADPDRENSMDQGQDIGGREHDQNSNAPQKRVENALPESKPRSIMLDVLSALLIKKAEKLSVGSKLTWSKALLEASKTKVFKKALGAYNLNTKKERFIKSVIEKAKKIPLAGKIFEWKPVKNAIQKHVYGPLKREKAVLNSKRRWIAKKKIVYDKIVNEPVRLVKKVYNKAVENFQKITDAVSYGSKYFLTNVAMESTQRFFTGIDEDKDKKIKRACQLADSRLENAKGVFGKVGAFFWGAKTVSKEMLKEGYRNLPSFGELVEKHGVDTVIFGATAPFLTPAGAAAVVSVKHKVQDFVRGGIPEVVRGVKNTAKGIVRFGKRVGSWFRLCKYDKEKYKEADRKEEMKAQEQCSKWNSASLVGKMKMTWNSLTSFFN